MNWLIALMIAGGVPSTTPATHNIGIARQALQVASASYGPRHPATAMMLRNLALAFEQAGYHNYATRYAGEALAILQAQFGPADPSLVPALNVLAEAAASEGRYVDAERFARRAVSIGPDAGAHYEIAVHNLTAIRNLGGAGVALQPVSASPL